MINNKKVKVLIIIGILILSCIVLTNEKSIVEATPPEDIELDYQYIYNITENLSNVIFNAYNEYNGEDIAKGRAFGTKGEKYARDIIIKPEMINLNLYNPSLDPPYLD